MALRFPLNEAPNHLAKESVENSISLVHQGGASFPIVRDDGQAMLGPYGPVSYSTDVAHAICMVLKTTFAPNLVKPRNRELAAMALVATVKLPYMVYCHRLVGAKLGLTPEQCNDALSGRMPQGLTEEEMTAYDLGGVLSTLNGPLSDDDWQKFTSKMEKTQIVGIANVIGSYKWITTLVQLNGNDENWVGE
ncbi:hypothetical protein F5B20DRAFT_555005 [Whalleya microplaca]|nr:hypothetical protein F5B20DRAFT_555005 [Whalleya microplaca]